MLAYVLAGALLAAAAPPTTAVSAAVPAWLENKKQLTAEQLKKKQAGVYFTGFPIVNYDPDRGAGYGARVYLYDNGARSDPIFKFSPYRHRLFVQYYQTTAGFRSHAIKWDAPYFLGTRYRVRSALAYERDILANYFGVGEATLGPRRVAGRAFTDADAYTSFIERISSGRTLARYDNVDVFRPRWNIHLERDIAGGLLRPLIGFQVAKVTVRDYSGSLVEVGGDAAIQAPTRLREDAAAGRILGFDGGWDNTLKLGIAYDTRDYEPNPASGAFHDFTFETARRFLGSEFDFNRYNLSLRAYHALLTRDTDVTLAWRAMYQVQTGDVPFYEMSSLAFTQGNDLGLGGLRTIRGFSELRFIGPVAALANVEARWQIYEHVIWGQRFGYMVSPFVDTGRVFDRVGRTTLTNWETGYGVGGRFIWNLATILAVDYGRSREGDGIYVNFQLMF